MTDAATPDPTALRSDRPHPARIYNYLLGGSDYFPADRAAAEAGLAVNPGARVAARANREFLRRAVTHLTGDAGLRQFLDIGSGIPAAGSTHLVARAIAPESHVVYVDNDPLVVKRGRALPADHGAIEYISGDLREPERILARATATLDLGQPVGLLLLSVTHHLRDEDDPHALVAGLLAALPAGSYLALSQVTPDLAPDGWRAVEADFASRGGVLRPRTRAEITRFFDGLELVEPGLTVVHRWRPDERDQQADQPDALVSVYGGVARKP
ncbi:SAM-dependent methyltransferase [Cryptosporangium aurantiacum]|uniref:S-adenosyl methyltransferase n=1 Tax=Cryptosporangium aurantiacum TaxID=134849 RepID=A0A1M7RK45_9ACTN|nr:SAM-dependent methyltransferase [Cryptosporangium aurantiacum]SHN46510.1 S-adenosyl methyltransferase [Cryptosporangium aurantiacum]